MACSKNKHPRRPDPGADSGDTGRGKSRNGLEKIRRRKVASSSIFFLLISTFSSSGVPTIRSSGLSEARMVR